LPENFKIQVENSAPSQNQPAKSVRWSSPLLHSQGVTTIADIGCGRLRNLRLLSKYFREITLIDTQIQCERISHLVPRRKGIRLLTIEEFKRDRHSYDAVFVISVLHIIPKPRLRRELLSLASSKLHNPGALVIDVPSGEHYYRQHCTSENRYRDGWTMGNGSVRTFYKNFHSKELDLLVASCTGLTLETVKSEDKHLIRIWRNSRT
jgi:hypothetical protein